MDVAWHCPSGATSGARLQCEACQEASASEVTDYLIPGQHRQWRARPQPGLSYVRQ